MVGASEATIAEGVKEVRRRCREALGLSPLQLRLVPMQAFRRTYDTVGVEPATEQRLKRVVTREFGVAPILVPRSEGGMSLTLYAYLCPGGHEPDSQNYLLLELWAGDRFIAQSLTQS